MWKKIKTGLSVSIGNKRVSDSQVEVFTSIASTFGCGSCFFSKRSSIVCKSCRNTEHILMLFLNSSQNINLRPQNTTMRPQNTNLRPNNINLWSLNSWPGTVSSLVDFICLLHEYRTPGMIFEK